jgi:2-polyprenyl-3-methyl-5-hydroxy-6-metoxy-1,4-benzoquinol methylase
MGAYRHRLNEWFIVLLSLIIGLLINLPFPFPLRLSLGALFFFFLPGFSLLRVLKIKNLDGLTIMLLSVGLSLGLTALIGVASNYFLGVINLKLMTLSCILIIICLEVINAFLKRPRTKTEFKHINKNQVKKYWSKYSQEKWIIKSVNEKLQEYYSRAYIFYCSKWLNHLNGMLILDAGMGDGRYLHYFLKTYKCQAFGVDISKECISLARATASEANVIQADVENLPFRSDSFDVVISFGVIEHTNTERAFKELIRVAKPGGTIIVSVPNKVSAQALFVYVYHWRKNKRASIGKLFTISELKELMKQEGLVDIAFGGIDIRPYLIKPSRMAFLFQLFHLIETKDTWLNRWLGWMLIAKGTKSTR